VVSRELASEVLFVDWSVDIFRFLDIVALRVNLLIFNSIFVLN